MKYLSYIIKPSLLNKLAFYSLLGSSAYIILLWSPNILGKYIGHWTKVYLCIFPWIMVCLAYSWQVVANREHRYEIILMISIIIFGVINAALSDVLSKSIPHMRIFLITGIFVLWASTLLVTSPHRRQVFDWFCCGCLATIVPVEIIWWLIRDVNHDGVFHVFTLHPIPLGSLIILLSPGPIHLIASKNLKLKMSGLLLCFSGLFLIFVTHKRGTWLALAAMLVVAILYLARRRRYLMVTLLVVMTLILSIQAKRTYDRLDPSVNRYVSVLQRLELYNFALHVWKTHPIMGLGLRPLTHAKYLKDYHLTNNNLVDFDQGVGKLQTFDNMVLTGFVEMGSLMTLTYLGLVIFIVVRYVRTLRSSPTTAVSDWYRLLVILGLAIHSLSYDALLFPPINWLFHLHLGIMAGYHATENAADLEISQRQVAA